MTLRLLEVVVPAGRDDDLQQVVDEADIVDCWRLELRDDKAGIRLLLQGSRAEAVMDRLDERYGHMPGFRVALLDVALTLPPVAEPEPVDEGEERIEPRFGRISRQELHNAMLAATRSDFEYFVMVLLAVVVAAIGLLNDNVAVVIAAMVIAPLLGPNISLALATIVDDGSLARRSAQLNFEGVGLALVLSTGLGFALRDSQMLFAQEVLARTTASPGDFALALAAGVAGTLSFTTRASGTLIGVMVAVALMPPTIVLGLMMGAGRWDLAAGASLLLATNLISVNLAAVATFYFLGVRPARWWQADRARRATIRALVVWSTLLAILAAVVTIHAGEAV